MAFDITLGLFGEGTAGRVGVLLRRRMDVRHDVRVRLLQSLVSIVETAGVLGTGVNITHLNNRKLPPLINRY